MSSTGRGRGSSRRSAAELPAGSGVRRSALAPRDIWQRTARSCESAQRGGGLSGCPNKQEALQSHDSRRSRLCAQPRAPGFRFRLDRPTPGFRAIAPPPPRGFRRGGGERSASRSDAPTTGDPGAWSESRPADAPRVRLSSSWLAWPSVDRARLGGRGCGIGEPAVEAEAGCERRSPKDTGTVGAVTSVWCATGAAASPCMSPRSLSPTRSLSSTPSLQATSPIPSPKSACMTTVSSDMSLSRRNLPFESASRRSTLQSEAARPFLSATSSRASGVSASQACSPPPAPPPRGMMTVRTGTVAGADLGRFVPLGQLPSASTTTAPPCLHAMNCPGMPGISGSDEAIASRGGDSSCG